MSALFLFCILLGLAMGCASCTRIARYIEKEFECDEELDMHFAVKVDVKDKPEPAKLTTQLSE